MGIPIPANESARLRRLRDYKILDTPPEAAFDRVTRIAASVVGVPIALISLVDDQRQWFKSRVGLDAPETPRSLAFCAHAIMSNEVFEVQDAAIDPLFAKNPLVTGNPHIRFYAGAPLTTMEGVNLGTVCVIDRIPRALTPEQRIILQDLSALAVDELELRVAARKALNDVAERVRLDQLKTEFIANVGHELRTPLTSIIGAVELLTSGAAGDLPEQPTHLLQMAERNAQILMRLINDLMDSAKLESGRMDFDFEPVDIAEIVHEAVASIFNYRSERGVAVSVTKTAPLVVQADRHRLRQVLDNLLSNAIKFSPERGQVDVGIERRDGRAVVTVTDRGDGIPPELQPRLFQKFAQARRKDGRFPGTGLGLSIAKQIIEAHAGEITFTSIPALGTVFEIHLPTT